MLIEWNFSIQLKKNIYNLQVLHTRRILQSNFANLFDIQIADQVGICLKELAIEENVALWQEFRIVQKEPEVSHVDDVTVLFGKCLTHTVFVIRSICFLYWNISFFCSSLNIRKTLLPTTSLSVLVCISKPLAFAVGILNNRSFCCLILLRVRMRYCFWPSESSGNSKVSSSNNLGKDFSWLDIGFFITR